MVRLGVSLNEDDILHNPTNVETMQKSNTRIPFKGGQEMHVSTLRALIHLCNPHGSLVVNMNSSIKVFFTHSQLLKGLKCEPK
jgi:hypothetical protein